MTNNDVTSREPMISPEALALLGGGKIAYVKAIRSEDVRRQFRRRRNSRPARCSMPCMPPTARRSC